MNVITPVVRSMSVAYETLPWHELFQGVIGAAATLAGLVLLAGFVLTPGQARVTVGVEITTLGLGLTTVTIGACIRAFDPSMRTEWKVRDVTVSTVATVPMVVAGVSLIAAAGGGLYWALAEAMCGFIAALYYAWILLVEIKR